MKISLRQAAVANSACKPRDGRPILTSVNVVVHQGVSTATSTDTYRLLSVSTKTDEADRATTYNSQAVGTGLKLAKVLKQDYIDLQDSEVVECSYPNWEALKPDEATQQIVNLDRKLLIELLQSIDSQVVRIGLGTQLAPVTIEARADYHDYYAIIMPRTDDAVTGKRI